ncbi:MAG: translation initiation factor IF-3 [Deltaproteobacteria bacterium]|nr:translation initiation factor IF-3 [Deltaproteobacteria bacterium]
MFRRGFRSEDRPEPAVRVNQRIRVPEVRLIGADGAMIGIMSSMEALDRARSAGLDLVEVNPKAAPPVCRLMDYGKFKYEQKKQANLARKRQTVIEIKEIKFRPKTDDHDYDFKMRHIRRFLADGDKAKITVRFRGREMAHPQVAQHLLDRIVNELKDEAVLEQASRMEGRTMFLLLAPKAGIRPPVPVAAEPVAPAPRPAGPLPPTPRPPPPAPSPELVRDERDLDRDDDEDDDEDDDDADDDAVKA